MIDKITTAIKIADFDAESIDLPLLVGALVHIKRWAECEPHLLALKKKSLCTSLRISGENLINDQSKHGT